MFTLSPAAWNTRAIADKDAEILRLHVKLAGETLRADQGWERYEDANKSRLGLESIASVKPSPFTDTASFKNFHRCLCERFGYAHDEVYWWRDLMSLEEHIAASVKREPQWLPIESAPKDGTCFLAYHDGRVDFWHWQDFKDGSKAPIGWRNFITVYPDGEGPALWMPKPPPPVTATTASKGDRE